MKFVIFHLVFVAALAIPAFAAEPPTAPVAPTQTATPSAAAAPAVTPPAAIEAIPAPEVTPKSAVEHHQAGLKLYQEQKFVDAMAEFQAADHLTPDNVFTLYNWGLAAYKVDQKGLALGLWRRALDVDPGFSPAQSALQFARTQLPEQIFSPPGDFLESLKVNVVRGLSLDGLLLVNLLLLAFAGWLFLRYRGRLKRAYEDELPKPPFPWICAAFAALFLASVALLAMKGVTESEIRATAIENNLPLRTGPSEDMNSIFSILEGTEVLVAKVDNDWTLITYPGGMTGWVPTKSLYQDTGPRKW